VTTKVLNRVSGFLAWGGVFVAGVLTYAHYTNGIPPCGTGGGCAKVAADESSRWFGQPVALYGLVAYLLLAVLALLREGAVGETWKRLSKLSLWMVVGGFALSMMLMYTSLAKIRAECHWCIASAAIMTVLLMVHLALKEKEPPQAKESGFGIIAPTFVGIVLAAAMFGFTEPRIRGSAQVVNLGPYSAEDLIPPANRLVGSPDAPITVIEFADINCPACRSSFLDAKVIVTNGKGKVRMGFRHYPLYTLEGHESSIQAAVVSQFAAKEGKFWAFLEKAYDPANTERVKTVDGLISVALEVGLDEAGVKKALQEDSAETDQVVADFVMTQTLGIKLTPSFIVIAPGTTPKIGNPVQLARLLAESPYREIINGR